MTDEHIIDPVDAHVGARVRALRNIHGINQVQLGEASGVSFQQVQKYERGANRISASTLKAFADRLGCKVGDFFDGLEAPGQPVDISQSAVMRMATAEGGVSLARIYVELEPHRRNSLLNVARALQGETA